MLPCILSQREGVHEIREIGFEFRKQRYVYNPDLKHVEKLKYPIKAGPGWEKWGENGHGQE